MSKVTERVMANGDWEVNLRPDTPASVVLTLAALETAVGFGTIVVTDPWVPATDVPALMRDPLYEDTAEPGTIDYGDPGPLPYDVGPRYSGTLMRCRTDLGGGVTISGKGLQSLLGDGSRGQFMYRRTPLDDLQIPPGVDGSNLFNWALDGFTAGADYWDWEASPLKRRYYFVGADDTELFGDGVAGWFTRVELLDLIAARFGTEWVVRSTGFVDMGTPAQLYPFPRAVVTRKGGNDRNADGDTVTGLTAQDLSVDADLDSFANKVLLQSSDLTGVYEASTPHRDPFGRVLEMGRSLERSDVPGDVANAYALAEVVKLAVPHREISLSTSTHDGIERIICGQEVWIFDPLQGLAGDVLAAVMHRGEWIFPVADRVIGYTWPIRAGMGVHLYYWESDSEPTVLDLTEWVEWDEGPASIAVGDAPRPVFPSSASKSQLIDENDDLYVEGGQGHVGVQRRVGTIEAWTADDIPAIDLTGL